MTEASAEPGRELREEVEGVGNDVFRSSTRARRQDMANSVTEALNAALREQGRESEVMTPREFAAQVDTLLADPQYVAKLEKQLGRDAVQRILSERQESLFEPEDGDG